MFEPTDLQWVFGLRKVFLVQRLQLYKLLRGKDSYAVKIKNVNKSFYHGIPLYDTDICRILVSGYYIWDIHECVGIQLLVSDAYECYDFCRLD